MNKYAIIVLAFLLFMPLSYYVSAQENTKPKIGLVLSGGGAKGLAHVGVIKVLEEAGIRPDFIGGTSMGSIIGALYAIGYSVDSLDYIARNYDWIYFFTDEISRRDLALEEKEDADRFFVSVPIQEKKIQIPTGVISGQNIENRLNTIFAPVYNVRNFDNFQIPFLCIATDIETGKEVVFREGYLPKVIRSSMSIPSIFNPIEIDNKLLVDGGVVNNFPVNRVKEMGADIIIGVDVGFSYYKKEELNSIIKIFEQSVFFYGEELNTRNRNLCDILIEPAMDEFSVSSFASADSIIAAGEQAARKALPEITKLAKLLGVSPGNLPVQNLELADSLQIMEIRINGLEKVSKNLVIGKLQLEVFDKVIPKDIERSVERLYSSLYFESIDYELAEMEDGVRLIINIKEAKEGQFRLGLHYDTNYRSSILLNVTIRNLVLDGSKLSTNIGLGENPFFKSSYFINNGWKPGFGIEFTSFKQDVYIYDHGLKISSLSYAESKIRLFTQSTFWNSYALGAGLEYESIRLNPIINPLRDLTRSSDEFLNYYGFIKMDSYDNAFYPQRGIKFDSQLKFITNKDQQTILFIVGRYSQAYKLSPKMTFINHFYGGAVDGDTIPYQYSFYTGGTNPLPRNGLLPFVGLDYMERVDKNVLIWATELQYEIFPDIYAITKLNIGSMQDNFLNILHTDKLIGGYGFTLGYDSFIGPIEFTIHKGIEKSGLLGFVNIGFWF